MKVQVPTDDAIDLLVSNYYFKKGEAVTIKGTSFELSRSCFKAAIAWANEQIASPPPTKTPFLSDAEIEANAKHPRDPVAQAAFTKGAHWARDKYEARDGGDVATGEPKWQPVVGQLVAAWGHNYYKEDNLETVVGIYQAQKSHDGYHIIKGFNDENDFYRSYVAALETLDEIGKPPQYFQERGRSTV